MLQPGLAKKIVIHLNEDTTARTDFLYREIFAFLLRKGVAGASLIRPQAGFGSHHRVHEIDADGAGGDHLPIRIEFIDSPGKIDALLPELYELISDGVIEAQDTMILRSKSSGAQS